MKKTLIATILLIVLAGPHLKADNWWENMKIKGDFRYRHEMIDYQGSDARNRQRIRARLGIYGDANDYTKIGMQLATGSDDPVSSNQTLDGGFSTKNLMLDMAYLEIAPKWNIDLTLTAGKFKNQFYKPGHSELLWDSDLNPEGGLLEYETKGQDYSFTLIGAGLWIDERSSGKDSWLAAGEGVLRYFVEKDKSDFAIGGGVYNYVNAKGYAPFFDPSEPMGNSVDANGLYINDYKLLEMFAEGNYKFDKIPVTAMFDYVTNTGADSLNTGWLVGIRVNKTGKPGTWDFRYIYRRLEKDAVVGIYTDSDFRGGGTDAKGHEIGGSYQIARNSELGLTYFINQIGLGLDDPVDFKRLQADLQLKF